MKIEANDADYHVYLQHVQGAGFRENRTESQSNVSQSTSLGSTPEYTMVDMAHGGMYSGGGHEMFRFGESMDEAFAFVPGHSEGSLIRDDEPHDQQHTGPQRLKATRSSKACDSCRKQKSKCERPDPNQPCKNCVLLSTPCTSLRPSRKRGPPKGYIDRLECALHQCEALLGVIMAVAQSSFSPASDSANTPGDQRAQSLLEDLRQDSLARQILDRIDRTPYGIAGRKRPNSGNKTALTKESAMADDGTDISSTHPSNEWQEQVLDMLVSANQDGPSSRPVKLRVDPSYAGADAGPSRAVNVIPAVDDDGRSPRQRRRLDDANSSYRFQQSSDSPASPRYGILDYVPSSPSLGMHNSHQVSQSDGHYARRSFSHTRSESTDGSSLPSESAVVNEFKDRGEDPDWIGAIGQLSLNEEEEVRYHGRASGLHLLGNKERGDGRNAGGIWRFPKARVWPPLPDNSPSLQVSGGDSSTTVQEADLFSRLPNLVTQQQLLDVYFTYVHPSFPVIPKHQFLSAWRTMMSSPQEAAQVDQHSGRRKEARRNISLLLLFSVFSIAARHSSRPPTRPPSPDDSQSTHIVPPMWVAGDDYFELARTLLNQSYTTSRLSTCQSLLLLAYREIGIGAMAQSWIYTGMAIRMAQDLGLHRSADGWARAGLGGKIFSTEELQERKRIWYACVIMDKYVSAYIGRPLAIYERDFDTSLPEESEPEELEEVSFPSRHQGGGAPVPSRILSCFNAAARLSGILSRIIQVIYTVRPLLRRRAESVFLEGILDKWYFELPYHLRYEPGSGKRPIPPPHILTLHMQYWCAVLLLHRPFMLNSSVRDLAADDGEEGELRSFVERSDGLCAAAANHIASIAALYAENYDISKCSVFLCYYIFTAGIMHVTTLSVNRQDPQAQMGFLRCIEALKAMEIVWPSAGRALVLLSGASVNITLPTGQSSRSPSNKRPADPSFDSGPSPMNYGSIPQHPQSFYTPHTQTANMVSDPSSRTSASMPYYYPNPSTSTSQYSGALSTSVLPQMYSTGLVDDRGSMIDYRGMASSNSARQEQRFPQYWHDYSTFPQIDTAYGATFAAATPQQQSSPVSPTYVNTQFPNGIYNNNNVS